MLWRAKWCSPAAGRGNGRVRQASPGSGWRHGIPVALARHSAKLGATRKTTESSIGAADDSVCTGDRRIGPALDGGRRAQPAVTSSQIRM
jgi:hypothetical protein